MLGLTSRRNSDFDGLDINNTYKEPPLPTRKKGNIGKTLAKTFAAAIALSATAFALAQSDVELADINPFADDEKIAQVEAAPGTRHSVPLNLEEGTTPGAAL